MFYTQKKLVIEKMYSNNNNNNNVWVTKKRQFIRAKNNYLPTKG